MLILTRRIGEAITVGDAITVTLLGVKGPPGRFELESMRRRNVAVHREEIVEKIKREGSYGRDRP